mmetsp:Transcript_32992/g.50509  ORF Transcript_32992/g.50509 Transcript_32992/m.50509 type:complete len:96 (+) Transcript_32992:3461-3748(+)
MMKERDFDLILKTFKKRQIFLASIEQIWQEEEENIYVAELDEAERLALLQDKKEDLGITLSHEDTFKRVREGVAAKLRPPSNENELTGPYMHTMD